MKHKIYGAYGSNINLYQMEQRCPKAKHYETGFLNGYELVFRASGVANVEKKEGSKVPILLWKITDDCEKALDRYEGYPSFYIKKEVEIVTGKGLIKAFIYVMQPKFETYPAIPFINYFDSIKQGYKDAGLPMVYLTSALVNCRMEVARTGGRKNG